MSTWRLFTAPLCALTISFWLASSRLRILLDCTLLARKAGLILPNSLSFTSFHISCSWRVSSSVVLFHVAVSNIQTCSIVNLFLKIYLTQNCKAIKHAMAIFEPCKIWKENILVSKSHDIYDAVCDNKYMKGENLHEFFCPRFQD